jgi:hypothetical protein
MNNLKRLGAAIALTCVLGVPALAGQILTPCPPPEPGQILTPCDPGTPASPGDIGTMAPGEMGTPTFTEIAADIILIFLPLF